MVREGYKQTEVGVIPEVWEVGKLDDYLSFISYGFTNPMPVSESGVFMITAANISDGEVQYSTARKTTETAYQTLLTSKSKPRKGDVLLTKDGTLGRVAVVGEQQICINQSVAVIRLNGKILPQFLKLLLESPEYQQKMLEDAGGTTIRHIYITVVNLMPIAVPPTIEEQRVIAQALSDVDALIAALDKAIAKKRHLKTATMQQLLTGKKRLPGFGEGKGYQQTEVGVIPEGWVLTPLEKISAFITKGSTPTTYGFSWVQDGILFLRSECVSENGLDLSQSMFISRRAHTVLSRSELRSGDILITITGNVGRVVYLGDDFGIGNMNQHIARVRITSDSVNSGFIYHFLTQSSVRKAFNTITTGQAYPQISLKQVRDTIVPLPSLPEQRAIATVLSDMDAEVTALETRLAKTQALKQGMMQQLLTGKTRLIDS